MAIINVRVQHGNSKNLYLIDSSLLFPSRTLARLFLGIYILNDTSVPFIAIGGLESSVMYFVGTVSNAVLHHPGSSRERITLLPTDIIPFSRSIYTGASTSSSPLNSIKCQG
jgi:hypothetical protein